MPELPEVETVVRTLRPQVLECCIERVDVLRERSLHPLSLPVERLAGTRISAARRRGKLALLDLARLYERMVMRRHTNGGYQNVVDELWRQCEAWNTNIIIMYQNVACKNMATVQGILDEQGRERGYHLIWIEHDLMDPRTVSRKTMRDKVNEYMRTVMRAEPIDPSLCDFDDENCM